MAISVPAIPIANPMSAFFSAGASLVPSPVTATTYPHYLKPVTSKYLSSGEERANTLKWGAISLNLSRFPTETLSLTETIPPTNYLKYFPSITV